MRFSQLKCALAVLTLITLSSTTTLCQNRKRTRNSRPTRSRTSPNVDEKQKPSDPFLGDFEIVPLTDTQKNKASEIIEALSDIEKLYSMNEAFSPYVQVASKASASYKASIDLLPDSDIQRLLSSSMTYYVDAGLIWAADRTGDADEMLRLIKKYPPIEGQSAYKSRNLLLAMASVRWHQAKSILDVSPTTK